MVESLEAPLVATTTLLMDVGLGVLLVGLAVLLGWRLIDLFKRRGRWRSWGVEQFSRFRPRVDREVCKSCRACVRACPSGAMVDFYEGKRVHTDCFACGACLDACRVEGALEWRRP